MLEAKGNVLPAFVPAGDRLSVAYELLRLYFEGLFKSMASMPPAIRLLAQVAKASPQSMKEVRWLFCCCFLSQQLIIF
jgi:hypothetical protein